MRTDINVSTRLNYYFISYLIQSLAVSCSIHDTSEFNLSSPNEILFCLIKWVQTDEFWFGFWLTILFDCIWLYFISRLHDLHQLRCILKHVSTSPPLWFGNQKYCFLFSKIYFSFTVVQAPKIVQKPIDLCCVTTHDSLLFSIETIKYWKRNEWWLWKLPKLL